MIIRNYFKSRCFGRYYNDFSEDLSSSFSHKHRVHQTKRYISNSFFFFSNINIFQLPFCIINFNSVFALLEIYFSIFT